MRAAIEPPREQAADRAIQKPPHRGFRATIFVVYLLIAIALSLTRIPICDEGWYADPAMNLLHHGSMGSPAIESAGTFLKGIDQKTYYLMPVYFLAQAAWYRILGANLISMRMLSVFAGAVALLSWYFIARKFAGDRLAAIVAGFVAIDTSFVVLAATGRSDILSAALGAAALACYVGLRESRLRVATISAHALAAASGLTHPIGGLVAFASLVWLQLHFDRRRLTASIVFAAALPYLIGAAAWGVYIAQAPDLFRAQFGGNSAQRLTAWISPLAAIKRELVERYIGGFTMGSAWTRLADLRLVVLAADIAALVFVACSRALRRSALGTFALVQAAMIAAILLLFEGSRQPWYLIYFAFPLATTLALTTQHLARKNTRRWPLDLAVAGFISLQIAYPALSSLQNKYGRTYLPFASRIRPTTPGRAVMGTAELGFALGFDRILDDYHLGFYSGKTPQYIVIDPRYQGFLQQLHQQQPELYQYATDLLSTKYRVAYSNGYYTLYEKQ